MVYYLGYDAQREPIIAPGNGSFATDSAHEVFRHVLSAYTSLDVVLQIYVAFLILRVSTDALKEYRYFMLLCTVSTKS